MKITEIHLGLARTFIPPGGDRYQPVKLDAGLVVNVEDGDDIAKVRAQMQVDLRAILEETYRAQIRPAPAVPQQPEPPNATGSPPPGFRTAKPTSAAPEPPPEY